MKIMASVEEQAVLVYIQCSPSLHAHEKVVMQFFLIFTKPLLSLIESWLMFQFVNKYDSLT